ncbi:hypothetical protein, partial [Nostoc sp.]|uniref:hypothetical protein n=1 Tax=Nostoc sp. TaxID=1180 RepID=UPI002FF5E6BB
MPKLVAQPPQRFVTATLDDLPVITDRDSDAVKLDTTNKLLASITKNKIPAIGFVNRPLAEIFYGMLKGLPVPILREYAIRTN